jgi:hypothetical protein
MLNSPFRYETSLTDADYQTLGRMSLRWSHTEHIIGNCLRVMMRLTEEEAIAVVFPQTTDRRVQLINSLSAVNPLPSDAKQAFDEFAWAWKKVQQIRNLLIHAIVDDTTSPGEVYFHLRSKKKSWHKNDVFSAEELTNFAAHAAQSFRFALGLKGPSGERHPLPSRPQLPPFLESI